MNSDIISNAKEYKKLALMIETSAKVEDIEDNIVIEDALLRLFYIKSLEHKLADCQEQLTEETDEETFNAVFEASETIQSVSEKIFAQIEKYAVDNRKFEIEIENTTVDTDSKDKQNLLNQLYKCEGIIRMAQRAAARYPIYGGSSGRWEHLEGIENDGGKSPQQRVLDDLGIDVYELESIREKLVVSLEKIVG